MKSTTMTEKQVENEIERVCSALNETMSTLNVQRKMGVLALFVLAVNAMTDDEQDISHVCQHRLGDIIKTLRHINTQPDPELN